MKCVFSQLLLLIGIPACSQLPQGFTYARLSGYSAIRPDAFSYLGNTAALARVKNISAAVYGESRFMLKELSTYKAGVCLPLDAGRFGFSGYFEGGSLYNRSQAGLAYARSMNDIDIGLQFNYCSFRIPGYAGSSSINFSLGSVFHITNEFQAGFQVENPVKKKRKSQEGSAMGSHYSAGWGWDVSEKLFLACVAGKDKDGPVNFMGGIRYSFDKKLRCGLGFISGPGSFYCAGGIVTGKLALDLTATLHPYLGLTPAVMMAYNPGK